MTPSRNAVAPWTLALLLLAGVGPTVGADWISWRGPLQCGLAPESAAVTRWSLSGENLLWKSPAGGRSVPIVHGGRVFLIGPVGEGAALGERVVCLDAATGRTLWEQRFGVYLTDIVENRVGWTAPAIDEETGNVYAHGTGGELLCLGRDGQRRWTRSLTEEFGRFSGYGGRLYTPVVDEERVIIGFLSTGWSATAPMVHLYAAFDKRDGRTLWVASPGERPLDTTYATPVVAVLGGRRLLICPHSDGWVYALLARNGQTVWKYRFAARPLNTSPVVSGDHVFVGHSEENLDTTVMGRVACIHGVGSGDVTRTHEVWRRDGIDAGYASPALAGGRLYVMDNAARLHCLDAGSGETKWEFNCGRIGRGSPVATHDGVVYVGEQNGNFFILRDAGEAAEVLSHVALPRVGDFIDELQGSPSVAGGRVYLQTRYGTYCLGTADPAPAPPASPPPPAEDDPGERSVARVQVEPAEVTVAPGEKVRFSLTAFTASGRRVSASSGELSPRWSQSGAAGTFDERSAEFTAASDARFSAGLVTVQCSGLDPAVARIRVCPKAPPFSEDFEALEIDSVPPGWVNVAQRVKVVERDGGKVLKTLSERPSPIFMRLRMYMTPPIAGGYTIQADVLGSRLPRWMPDAGLINTRYELRLLGNEQTLRIVAWDSIPRLQKDLPFEWSADTWYRVKFQVRTGDGRALLRAKAWPRDQAEPDAWAIEAEDPHPYPEGSPALYAYTAGTTEKRKGTEVYFDNVKVTENE